MAITDYLLVDYFSCSVLSITAKLGVSSWAYL